MPQCMYDRQPIRRRPDAPVLLVALDDGRDPGYTRAGCVSNLLRRGHSETVALYSADKLLDYRLTVPTQRVTGGVMEDLRWPEIAQILGDDPTGSQWSLLHGPAPTFQWQGFAQGVSELARDLGVRVAVSVGSVAASVPHTRPVRVLGTGTSGDLLSAVEPWDVATVSVAAGVDSAVLGAIASQGIPAVNLTAMVPSYVSGAPYPAASTAVLEAIARMTGLKFDLRALRAGADTVAKKVSEYMETNADYATQVRALEAHLDGTDDPRLEVTNESDIARELEEFLRHQGGSRP